MFLPDVCRCKLCITQTPRKGRLQDGREIVKVQSQKLRTGESFQSELFSSVTARSRLVKSSVTRVPTTTNARTLVFFPRFFAVWSFPRFTDCDAGKLRFGAGVRGAVFYQGLVRQEER